MRYFKVLMYKELTLSCLNVFLEKEEEKKKGIFSRNPGLCVAESYFSL